MYRLDSHPPALREVGDARLEININAFQVHKT